MIENLPPYISIAFCIITFATLTLFVLAIGKTKAEATKGKLSYFVFGLVAWLAIQALLTLNSVYSTDTSSFPPKIMLMGIFPALLVIILLFITHAGKQFIDSLSLEHLTYLHTIRIPVEIVLYWLFLNKAVPELMTFEGRNFDIIAGITAPIVAYFAFTKRNVNRVALLSWNVVCLALLLNIVVNALFSTPSPIQKFAFDQPNMAILNFPFSWLPTFIVPIVLLSHLVAIRQLWKVKTL